MSPKFALPCFEKKTLNKPTAHIVSVKSMTEVTVRIPKELESEFRMLSKADLDMVVGRALKSELERVARFKQIVSKSKMTQRQADKLADEISTGLAERYNRLYA